MYNVMAKYQGAYAIVDTQISIVEAVNVDDVKALLYFGVQLQGLTYDEYGKIKEEIPIRELTYEDITEEDEEEEEYEEDGEWEEEEEYEEEYGEFDEEYGDDEIEYDDEEYEEEDEWEEEEEYEDEDEYYDDEDFYADDDDLSYGNEKSTVQKLYDFLDKEQEKLLKRYYLWYSQRLFVEASKDPNLGMKDKNRIKAKKEILDKLRNEGGMWHYAGFIDMGYEGGYCTLGHPLRYMHIAWDVTKADLESSFFGDNFDLDVEEKLDSTDCIIFGIKCISDFFEVDSECTASLQRAQRESIKDMGIMYEQYQSGQANEVNSSFALMDELMHKIKIADAKGAMFSSDYKPILKDGYIKFYEQFRSAFMPVPKSLVQEIRDSIVGWTSHKFYKSIGYPKERFTQNMMSLYPRLRPMGDSFKFTNHVYYYTPSIEEMIFRYFTILYTYKMCGVFEYDADKNKDEGGSSENTRTELHGLHSSQKRNFFSDAEYSQDYANKVAQFATDYVDATKKFAELVGLVLDSKYYIKVGGSRFSVLYMEKEGSDNKLVNELLSTLSLYEDHRSAINLKRFASTRSTIEDWKNSSDYVIDTLRKILAFSKEKSLEEEKAKEDMVEEQKRLKELAEKEEKQYATLDQIIEYMQQNPEPHTDEKSFSFAERIWKEMVKKGRKPSGGNIPYIEKLYTRLTGIPVKSSYTKLRLADYPEYITVVDYMINSGTGFIKDVCTTVKNYGTFTPKQRIHLDEAIQIYNSQTGNNLKTPKFQS